MPVITDPGEPYFKDGIWGWDAAADLWLPITIDPATGHLIVNPGASFEVHQDTPADMQVGAHGWDGTNWRRLPLLWGFSDNYFEQEIADNVAAGTRTLIFSQVPAGEVWVITALAAWANQTDPTLVSLRVRVDGVTLTLKVETYPTASVTIDWTGFIVLNEDDYVYPSFSNCVLNNDIRATAAGYKMLIAE